MTLFKKKDCIDTFSEMVGDVAHFHNTFKITNRYQPNSNIGPIEVALRYKLAKEELDEYLEAAREGNMVEIIGALGDQLYILLGTIMTHGMQNIIAPVFEAIQKSNMSKLDENGNTVVREDGKILKSNLYTPPTNDIKEIIRKELNEPVIDVIDFNQCRESI